MLYENEEAKGLPNKKNGESEKETLRSWSVKLSERVIEDIEMLYQLSGSRYKNEFVEKLVEKHKVNLMKEGGKPEESFLHPSISKGTSQDLYELNKLTGMMQHLYITQAEKFSMYIYEMERLQKEKIICEQEKRILQEKLLNLQTDIAARDGLYSSHSESLIHEKVRNTPPHTAYFGVSGSGKTVTAKKEVLHHLERGGKVIIIDDLGEYSELVKQSGGEVILQQDKGLYNLLTLESGSGSDRLLEKKINWLLALFEMSAERDIRTAERNALTKILYSMYKKSGITNEMNITEEQEMPNLESFLGFYFDEKNGKPLLERINDRSHLFERYSQTEMEQFVWPKECPIVSFDLSQVRWGVERQISYFVLFEQITRYLKTHYNDDVLFVINDSPSIIMNSKANVESLRQFFNQIGQYGVRILFVGNEPDAFLQQFEKERHELLQLILFHQSPRSKTLLSNILGLQANDIDFLLSCPAGNALVIRKDLVCRLSFQVKDIPKVKIEEEGHIGFSLF